MQLIHSGIACFCWAWPLSLLVLRWSFFGRNANLAGGFAGRRFVVFVCVFWLFPLFVDCCSYMPLCYVPLLVFTTSTSARTEPQATSAAPEKKKSDVLFLYLLLALAYVMCLVCGCFTQGPISSAHKLL